MCGASGAAMRSLYGLRLTTGLGWTLVDQQPDELVVLAETEVAGPAALENG
jgi:hypothetical protein